MAKITNSNTNSAHLRKYFKEVDKVMKQKGTKSLSGKTEQAKARVYRQPQKKR